MRIAVDARPLSMPITGIGRYTNSLLTEMISSGNEWFLYSDSPLNTEFSTFENVNIRCGKATPASASGLRYSQGRYRTWIKQDQPDVFWSPRHHLPLSLNKRIPQVLTIHDVVWKRFPETMTWQARSLERFLMPGSIRSAKKIICVSHFTAGEIEELWPKQADKCVVIPSGVAPSNAAEPCDDEHGKPYILFVGTLEPRKNLGCLLEAFALLVRDALVAEDLVIVGAEGWGKMNLASMTKSLNIEDRVSILGYVSDDRLDGLYRGARCLVMPSLYEGFGLPVLEAMRFGVPAIVSSAGALPEVAGRAGLIIDPVSKVSMANAIHSLMSDEILHEKLSKRAKRRSAEFSWQKAANETLRLFESLVA